MSFNTSEMHTARGGTKMALKVEVISKEIIRPYSPTPSHLRTLKLSLIDQYILAVPVSVLQFYSAKKADEKQLYHLEKSLSEVLTDFYPLAGRVSGNQFVDCNDEGVNFVETRVIGQLGHFLSHPEAGQLSQLLPTGSIKGRDPKALLSIQANYFDCGGIAIAVSISHKVGDASSLCLFVNHWAAVSRGERKPLCPKFKTSSIFPPQDESPPTSEITLPIQKLVSKRFIFDARNIEALKSKISSNLNSAVPTRVEAVSALIWGCVVKAVRKRTGAVKPQSVLSFPVNLRGRLVPPLSNSMFGNLGHSTLTRTNTENHPELHYLVGLLRESIRSVDGNYAKQVQTHDGYLAHLALVMEAYVKFFRGELELCSLTSWCRFPFYEADFGWGEPIWVTYTDFSVKNLIGLMDTKCGQGVEAWVTLDEEDMASFQCEPDLIAFTSTSSMMC